MAVLYGLFPLPVKRLPAKISLARRFHVWQFVS
jgi:hypothetical protein